MRYSELRHRLKAAGYDRRHLVNWAGVDGRRDLRRVRYNIVPRGGKFILISADDRGEFFEQIDHGPDPKPVEFDTEDEACDWVWTEVTVPDPPAYKSTKTSEQLAEDRHRAEAEYDRWLAEYNREQGTES